MKLLIIGPVASGKTYLARKLSKELNIKYFEIDSIVHDDLNKVKRTVEEQNVIINKIDNENEEWILEGTLRKNLNYLLDLADKIIYLEVPVKIRKRRILFRFIKQKLNIEKCNYKPTMEMLKLMYKWTNDFENKREEFEKILLKYNNKIIKENELCRR